MARRVGNELVRMYQDGGPADRIAALEAEFGELMGDPGAAEALRHWCAWTNNGEYELTKGDELVMEFDKEAKDDTEH